jgi:hypothetical protein
VLPWRSPIFGFRAAAINNSLIDGATLDVNVTSLADDVITAGKFDESTAFPLKAADTGSTQVARTGADGDTLKTLSDEIATVQADLDNPDQYKADVSGIPAAVWGYATRTLSSFGTLISDIWSHATRTLSAFGFTVATQSDANVTAIKAKTDNLPASPAPAGEYDARLTAIQTDLDNPNQYKADVSALAKTTHVQEVEDKVDAVKLKTDNIPANPAIAGEYTASLAAIQADLDNPAQYKADVSGIPAAVWGYTTRTLSSFGTLISDIWAHATRTLSAFGFTVATQSDANITAIKAKTDNLPTSPAATGDAMTLTAAYDHAKDDVLTPLGVVDGVVDAIKLKTDKIPANPATAGEYTASLAAIQADVSGIPDAILTKAIVDTLTVEQVLKVLAAVETGITTGGGTDTIVYTGKDGTEIRLTGVDENGNRTAVIVTLGA